MSITLAAGDDVVCTYTNTAQTGAIEITKTEARCRRSGDHAHSGVAFTITGGSLPEAGKSVVTDSSGKACVDGLSLDDYTVAGTDPTGYASDDDSKDVSVTELASCEDEDGQGGGLVPKYAVDRPPG